MAITSPKTKQELALQYGVSLKTLRRWMKLADIHVPRGLITPVQLNLIYHKIGFPGDSNLTFEIKDHPS